MYFQDIYKLFVMRYLTRANRLKQFAGLNEITRRPFERSSGIILAEYIFGNGSNIPCNGCNV